jgi:hypothetical protein
MSDLLAAPFAALATHELAWSAMPDAPVLAVRRRPRRWRLRRLGHRARPRSS